MGTCDPFTAPADIFFFYNGEGEREGERERERESEKGGERMRERAKINHIMINIPQMSPRKYEALEAHHRDIKLVSHFLMLILSVCGPPPLNPNTQQTHM